jgi:hypothetical protein
MDTTTPPAGHSRYPNTQERVLVQSIHWGIVLCIIIAVTLLAVRGQLDHASTTALFGTILGHAGTAASQKLQARSGPGADS